MISGTGGAEDTLAGFLRTATSGVVAGFEISCGVAILSSFMIRRKRARDDICKGLPAPVLSKVPHNYFNSAFERIGRV
jgi:hypothetical protein